MALADIFIVARILRRGLGGQDFIAAAHVRSNLVAIVYLRLLCNSIWCHCCLLAQDVVQQRCLFPEQANDGLECIAAQNTEEDDQF